MLVKVAAICPAPCGTRVEGEVETTSREFVHRFAFPPGRAPAGVPSTEAGASRLATFPPDSKGWFLPCALCGTPISIEIPGGTGA
jgi:hypothetical protein